MGMTTTEQAAWDAFDRRRAELKDKVVLMNAEIAGVKSQMHDLEIAAHERTAKFVYGDVIEYQKSVGFPRNRKIQIRRVVLYKYYWPYGDIRLDWRIIKKDFSLSDAYRTVWIGDREMLTAKKIGTWDFQNVKFVPIAE